MNAENTHILFGPPGTGKTTELLNIVDHLLGSGIQPNEICFISFTRKAANEAKTRAMEKFGFHGDQLPWFKTLHALAFHQLGLNRNMVMGVRDYIKIAEIVGVHITFKSIAEDGSFGGMNRGDKLFFMENMARALQMPVEVYWEKFPNEDVYLYELKRLHETIKQYKKETGKIDFNDMVQRFLDSGSPPPVKVLIIDEAQDLTPTQWKMAEKIAGNVEEVYIAGDDDQSIFRWAGADTDTLINLPGSRRILTQSYRCPAEVQKVADTIISRVSIRVKKDWAPRNAPGVVEYQTEVEHIDMSEGNWMLLGRNTYLLDVYTNHCLREGFIFESSTGSPISGTSFRAIRFWENLRAGDKIPAIQCKAIYEHMSTKLGVAYGFKTKIDVVPDNEKLGIQDLRDKFGLLTIRPWNVALDKISDAERSYFIEAIKRGEPMTEPRIRINTIHGVKGGEADNVVIQLDMADRTFKEFQDNPDDEHRVWYVAATRARERLIILSPKTNRAYDI